MLWRMYKDEMFVYGKDFLLWTDTNNSAVPLK